MKNLTIDEKVRHLILVYDRIQLDSGGKLPSGQTLEMVRSLVNLDLFDKEDAVVWDNFFSYILNRIVEEAMKS